MDTGLLIFLSVVATTFIAFQLLWDGQFLTYPMFRWIQQRDESTFVHIHQTYVKNLGIPTYLPSVLYLLATAAFLFIRPPEIPVGFPLVMNALNLIAVASTFSLLVPLHILIDRTERATAAQVERLIQYNLIRFIMIAINSIIVLYLLVMLLS